MKIAIITRWGTPNNYGQVLQCYALQKYLKDAGHEPYVIRFNYLKADFSRKFCEKILNIIKNEKIVPYIKLKIQRFLFNREKKDDVRHFDCFRKKHIIQSEKIYDSYSELLKNPPDADIYITGSDQVFGTEREETVRTINRMRAFFLDFGPPNIRKIAYSASFGTNIVDEIYKKELLPLLNKFEYISVREKEGIDICRSAGFNNVECVPDPTLLLSVNSYKELFFNEQFSIPKTKYCLLYLFNREDNLKIKDIYKWAKKRNIYVVYVASSGKYDKYKKWYPTIPEWLWLIKHAECVITHSYHCSIFSLHFQKKFAVIPQIGRDRGQNTRFTTLFELFDMKPRFINNTIDIVDEPIDWNKTLSIFTDIREKNKLLRIINREY